MRPRTVLFDLDGTLIDSGAIILASMRHAVEVVLGRTVPDDQLVEAVGGGGLAAQMTALDAARADELVRVYSEHNELLHADGLHWCQGMLELLEALQREGRRMGLVTAKRRATVQLAFQLVPLEPFFEVVVAAEDTERHKPYPDPLLAALDRLGAEPDDAVYVGDAPFDVRAAKAAGMHAIAVTWGGIHPQERLVGEAPDALVHTAEELLAALG